MEIFKPLPGFKNYEISNYGIIRNAFSGKVMKQSKNSCGYYRVSLSIEGDTKKYSVHRLVALSFIENKNNYKEVNHIDGNKGNNSAHNLEWCNSSQNKLHKYRVLGHTAPATGVFNRPEVSFPVVKMDLLGNEIQTYPSIGEAVRDGYIRSQVSRCCSGERKTHRGFTWKFQEVNS